MNSKPDFVAIPIFLAWILLSGYYAFRSWFDVDGLRESIRRDVGRLPSWYPVRDYTLTKLDSSSWKWQVRCFSTLGLLIGLIVLGLLIFLLL